MVSELGTTIEKDRVRLISFNLLEFVKWICLTCFSHTHSFIRLKKNRQTLGVFPSVVTWLLCSNQVISVEILFCNPWFRNYRARIRRIIVNAFTITLIMIHGKLQNFKSSRWSYFNINASVRPYTLLKMFSFCCKFIPPLRKWLLH